MNISQRQADGVAILDVQGKITIGVGDVAVREAVQTALDAGARNILLDLQDVSTIDSSGVGELVSAFTTVTNRGGKLKLAQPAAEGQRHPADHAADHRLRDLRRRGRGGRLVPLSRRGAPRPCRRPPSRLAMRRSRRPPRRARRAGRSTHAGAAAARSRSAPSRSIGRCTTRSPVRASACARCSPWRWPRCSARAPGRARPGVRGRDGARLFADPRRPAGDGRRRAAPRAADGRTASSAKRSRCSPPSACSTAPSRLVAEAAAAACAAPLRAGEDLVHHLAAAVGTDGLIGGQALDLESAATTLDLERLEYIHSHKTGALFIAAAELGAMAADARRRDFEAGYSLRQEPRARLPDRRRPARRRWRPPKRPARTPARTSARPTFVKLLGRRRRPRPGRRAARVRRTRP